MPNEREISVDNANKLLDSFGFDSEPDRPRPPAPAFGNGTPFDVPGWCAKHGVQIKKSLADGSGTKHVLEECPFNPDHKAPDAALFSLPSGAVAFKCLHSSCAAFKWQDVKKRYDRSSYDGTKVSTATNAQREAISAPEISYARITAAELDDADYKLEYLIEDTLTVGQPAIIAGGKKCLKTNVIIDAALSLATGSPFLGQLAVNRRARTCLMSGESGMATIQETARRICRAKGLQLRDVDGLIFSPDLPRVDDIRHQVALEAFLTGDGIEALFLDPAYLCLPADDNGNLFKMGMLLRNITEVCQQVGVTMFLVHHTKKNIADPFAPPELESIAWSGFQEFARQWWLIGRRKVYEPGTGHHELWLNVGGSAGHSALWALNIDEGNRHDTGGRRWDVAMASASDARKQAAEDQQATRNQNREQRHSAKVEAAKERIADALRTVPYHSDTLANIKARCGTKGAAFDDAFAYLLRTSKLVECEVERTNKQKYPGYQYIFETRS